MAFPELPDVELVVIDWLEDRTGRPASLTFHDIDGGPRNRVSIASGNDNTITEFPLVDIESFAASREAAMDLAQDSRKAMAELKAQVSGGWLVDTSELATRPVRIPYDNPAVHRVVASYRLGLRYGS